MSERPLTGLVLAGGGARGAYEIGVLRYVRERLKCESRFDVVTGTSVGAINGSYIAATCERPRAQGRMLQRVWSELSVDQVYRVGWRQLRELPRTLFGRDLPKLPHGARVGGLVDTTFLENVVRSRIPWRGITENLHRGNLRAFACSATEVATGITTVFVQSDRNQITWGSEPYEAVVPTAITAAHTLASAAIPGLFPAVRVGEQFFVDGSLRQNTPLRPAMRLGASRLLVVGLRHQEPPQAQLARLRDDAQFLYPNALFIAGKLLSALMIDRVESDLDRIARMNKLLEAGAAEFGPDFGNRLSTALGRDKPYEPVRTVMIRPSENLGQIAAEVVRKTRINQNDGLVARWIRRAVDADGDRGEADLVSFVLFDPSYVRRLIDLGYEDAAAQHDELMDLFVG